MKKAKTLNKGQFNKLDDKQQRKELKSMAKRANVRMSLLEETGIQNEVYYEAQDFNMGNGRIKNRFYEGTKYKTKAEVQEAYTALSNFLNNKKSTLGGLNDLAKEKVNNLIDQGQFDAKTLRNLTDKEKIYISKESAKRANNQLKELEKAHIDKFAYEVAGQYNKETGRPKNRFYTGGKFKNDKDLNIHIQNIFNFLGSETATARGYVDVIQRKLNTFRNNGLDISTKDEQKFLDFISSKQFEALKKYADSDQILETFVDARNKNIDIEKIEQEFEDYKNTDMTFDEVQERLGVAKYQGELLK